MIKLEEKPVLAEISWGVIGCYKEQQQLPHLFFIQVFQYLTLRLYE